MKKKGASTKARLSDFTYVYVRATYGRGRRLGGEFCAPTMVENGTVVPLEVWPVVISCYICQGQFREQGVKCEEGPKWKIMRIDNQLDLGTKCRKARVLLKHACVKELWRGKGQKADLKKSAQN